MVLIDLTGRRFGRLAVLGRATHPGQRHVRWTCVCDCGTEKEINGDAIKKGSTKSCGCLRRDLGTWNRGVSGPAAHSFRGHQGLPSAFFTDIRYKAGKRGIEFDLTIESIWNLFCEQRGRCALSGLPIEFEYGGATPTNCASLDRKDSRLGYVLENVQWVDRRINFMKQSASDEEFVALCKVIAEHNT